MDHSALYPVPLKAQLQAQFVGKSLEDVPTPAAVLDRAIVKRNCDQMLAACKALDVQFRPHVKTHKVKTSFVECYDACGIAVVEFSAFSVLSSRAITDRDERPERSLGCRLDMNPIMSTLWSLQSLRRNISFLSY